MAIHEASPDDRVVQECCRILNIPPESEWWEIRRAYRSLARKSHPDLNPGDSSAETRFKEISTAFERLKIYHPSDPERRQPGWTGFLERWPRLPRRFFLNATARFAVAWQKLVALLFPRDRTQTIHITPQSIKNGGKIKVHCGTETFELTLPDESWSQLFFRLPEKGDSGWFDPRRGDLLLSIHVVPEETPAHEGMTREWRYKIQVPKDGLRKGKMLTLFSHEGAIRFFLPKSVREGQKFTLKAKPGRGNAPSANHVVAVYPV